MNTVVFGFSRALPATGAEGPVAGERAIGALALVLLVSLVLLLLVLLGTFVFVRTLRRHRAAANRQRPAPTPADDVWAMHKLPEESED